jgi:molybdopterin converting factor small subunit
MRTHTGGQATVEANGSTVAEVLADLGARHAGITGRLFDGGSIRRFINVYLNNEDIRFLQNLETPTKDGDEISIIPAVAGGAGGSRDEEEEFREEEDEFEEAEVPEGVALFPEIPEDLGVHPLLLTTLHSIVFLAGSSSEVVNTEAAEEILGQVSVYLKRLEGNDLRRLREDMHCLERYAREAKWNKELSHSLKTLLADMGVDTTPGGDA